MAGAFHWVRLRTVSYATEKEGLLKEVMETLNPDGELISTRTEGHHGNPMTVLEYELTKNREFKHLFNTLGDDVRKQLLEDLDSRLDDDCTIYFRLDKQDAVSGVYSLAKHGDVISVSGKVVSHPARKEIAMERMREFLSAPSHQN